MIKSSTMVPVTQNVHISWEPNSNGFNNYQRVETTPLWHSVTINLTKQVNNIVIGQRHCVDFHYCTGLDKFSQRIGDTLCPVFAVKDPYSRVLTWWRINVDNKYYIKQCFIFGSPGTVCISTEDTEVSGGGSIQIFYSSRNITLWKVKVLHWTCTKVLLILTKCEY